MIIGYDGSQIGPVEEEVEVESGATSVSQKLLEDAVQEFEKNTEL